LTNCDNFVIKRVGFDSRAGFISGMYGFEKKKTVISFVGS